MRKIRREKKGDKRGDRGWEVNRRENKRYIFATERA